MNTARTAASKITDEDLSVMASAKQVVETVPLIMRLIRSGVRKGGRLSVPQVRVLGYLSRNPGAGVVDVATHLEVTPPTASALVDRLVRKTLIERKNDPLERRRTLLTLTDDGRAVLKEARGKAQNLVAEVLQTQTPEQLLKINEGLAILVEATKGLAL